MLPVIVSMSVLLDFVSCKRQINTVVRFFCFSYIRIRLDLYTAVLHDCDGRRHNFVPMTTATPRSVAEGVGRAELVEVI